MIGARARTAPDATAIVTIRGTMTFAELDERQRSLAGFLKSRGRDRGDRVAVLAANRPEYLEVTMGALRAGIVPVPLHAALTPREISYIAEDSAAPLLFTDRKSGPVPSLKQVITFGDAYERCLHEAGDADVADVPLTRPMHYTSGTTGTPRGVWAPPQSERRAAALSEKFARLWTLQSGDVHLVCAPLSHSAPHRFAMRTLESGGTVVLQERFEGEEALAAISLFGVTTAFMVPTHLERILKLGRSRLSGFDLSSVRLLAHAGSPIRQETKRAVIELFPDRSVWEFYGATEGQATRISTGEWLRKSGSVGLPEPGGEIVIRDEELRPLPAGETGEVWIRDPSTERFEYWRDPVKTKKAWHEETFTIGDLGYLDEDGYLFLVGRKHDTIISGGVNVYPQEVEQVLMSHPAVAEALVYGDPHDEWGEEVRALVVPELAQPLDPELLRAWARKRLAGLKCPRRIEVVESLPRTSMGKVRRRKL
jgi:long-chain acyl-CoA synthetase